MKQVTYANPKMIKKVIDFTTWIFVAVTILSLICTVLDTYQFFYIKHFDNYRVFQTSLTITMVFSSISVFDDKDRSASLVYSACCILIAVGALFFRLNGVF